MDDPLGHKSRELLEEKEDRFWQACFKDSGLDFFRRATVLGSDSNVSLLNFSRVEFLQHLYSRVLISQQGCALPILGTGSRK